MSKKTLLKGIIAVSAATTMLFSTAFAAKIDSTSTLYVKGAEVTTVEVKTVVSDLTAGDEVTYLAGEASNPVYINQYTVPDNTDGTEEYTYKTTRTDFAGTEVKMAKAKSDFTGGEAIDVSAASTIPDAEKFVFYVFVDGSEDATVKIPVNPNSVGTTVSFPFTLAANKEIDTVKVGDNDVTETVVVGDDTLTITHGVTVNVNDETYEFSPASANIVITTKDKEQEEVVYEAPAYTEGFKAPSYTYTPEGGDPISGPMYAIYAKSDKLPDDCTEFGIAIANSKEAFNANGDKIDHYKSTAAKGEDFGIAIIEADAANIPDVVYAQTYYAIKASDTVTQYLYSGNTITINVVK